jgi:hypothetical protein
MASKSSFFTIVDLRFHSRVRRETLRRVRTYGDNALKQVQVDLERADLRSSYREILTAVADRLRREQHKSPPITENLDQLLRRLKPRKRRSVTL